MEATYTFPLSILSIPLPCHEKSIVNCTLLQQQNARPIIFHTLHVVIMIGDIESRYLSNKIPNLVILDAFLSTNYIIVVVKEPLENPQLQDLNKHLAHQGEKCHLIQ